MTVHVPVVNQAFTEPRKAPCCAILKPEPFAGPLQRLPTLHRIAVSVSVNRFESETLFTHSWAWYVACGPRHPSGLLGGIVGVGADDPAGASVASMLRGVRLEASRPTWWLERTSEVAGEDSGGDSRTGTRTSTWVTQEVTKPCDRS